MYANEGIDQSTTHNAVGLSSRVYRSFTASQAENGDDDELFLAPPLWPTLICTILGRYRARIDKITNGGR